MLETSATNLKKGLLCRSLDPKCTIILTFRIEESINTMPISISCVPDIFQDMSKLMTHLIFSTGLQRRPPGEIQRNVNPVLMR